MSLGWVWFASFVILGVAMLAFMAGVFTGAGYAGTKRSARFVKIADFGMLALPASALPALVMLWVGYFMGWGAATYLWVALPALALALYLGYLGKGR